VNNGITRSGSFGPAAELAAAHTEIERLKAWSNEQIAKLAAANVELEAEVTRWREAWAKAQAKVDTTTHEWKCEHPPIFVGADGVCKGCGQPASPGDDEWKDAPEQEKTKLLAGAIATAAELFESVQTAWPRVYGAHVVAITDWLSDPVVRNALGAAVCSTHGVFKPTQEGCCPKCWAEHEWKDLDPER
jgi:hypothetical protein